MRRLRLSLDGAAVRELDRILKTIVAPSGGGEYVETHGTILSGGEVVPKSIPEMNDMKNVSVAAPLFLALLGMGTGVTPVAGPVLALLGAETDDGLVRDLDLSKGNKAYKAKDYETAMKWFLKFAKRGNAGAQYNLGVMYVRGEGVRQDFAEAVKWWRKAAEQGDADAQSKLGFMYAKGAGVRQSDAKAVEWYRKAAERGDADAQNRLGLMHGKGRGVPQSHVKAMKWYRKAAEQGHAGAQSALGFMYAFGRGTVRDLVVAHMWFDVVESGDEEIAELVVEARDRIASDMTSDQLSEARAFAKACVENEYKDCGR